MRLAEDILVVAGAGPLAGGVAYACNWMALNKWRRAKDAHWTERARLLFPARAAAASSLLTIPASLGLACYLWRPEVPLLGVCTALTAWLGVAAASIAFDREVFPWLTRDDLVRFAVVLWMMRFAKWFVLAGAILAMPETLGERAYLIGIGVVLFHAVWLWGGMVWVGRQLRLFRPASEQLRVLVAEVAGRMHVAVRRVWLISRPLGGAFALPFVHDVMFSLRLLERHPDSEIAAICAHELAHLTESKRALAARFLGSLVFVPWLFLKPAIVSYDVGGLAAVSLASLLPIWLARWTVRRLELRADGIAKGYEPDEGAYARALARLHEDNLIPAVAPSGKQTHPHLYDRLIAAGAAPDYPRPAAPATMAVHGRVFAVVVVILMGVAGAHLLE